jgi:hypothetical protein
MDLFSIFFFPFAKRDPAYFVVDGFNAEGYFAIQIVVLEF